MKIPKLTNVLFKTQLEVRVYDINYGHHLGHDSLISLLHEARVRFLKRNGYSEFNIEKVSLLVTGLYVNYTNEAFYGEELYIEIGIHQSSHASIDLLYLISKKEGVEIAKAITTIAFFDPHQRKICKIPTIFLEKLTSANL